MYIECLNDLLMKDKSKFEARYGYPKVAHLSTSDESLIWYTIRKAKNTYESDHRNVTSSAIVA